jgi:hypothetical protein
MIKGSKLKDVNKKSKIMIARQQEGGKNTNNDFLQQPTH